MPRQNKNVPPPINPLHAVGVPRSQPMTKEETLAAFAPDTEEIEEAASQQEAPSQQLEQPIEQPTEAEPLLPASQPAPQLQRMPVQQTLPPAPPVRRRRLKGLRFTDIY